MVRCFDLPCGWNALLLLRAAATACHEFWMLYDSAKAPHALPMSS